MPLKFKDLTLGCHVSCIQSSSSHVKVGQDYKVLGWHAPWHAPNGATAGPGIITDSLRNGYAMPCIAIQSRPSLEHCLDGWFAVAHGENGWWYVFDVDLDARWKVDFEMVVDSSSDLRLKHAKLMSESFEAMTEFHDVKLQVNGSTLTAPAILLSAASTVFRTMLASTMLEGSSRTVTIHGTSRDAAAAMVHYIIHGDLKVEPEEIANLTLLADRYNLLLLFEAALNYMPLKLTRETAAPFVKVVRLFVDSEQAAKTYKQLTKMIREDDALFEGLVEDLESPSGVKRKRPDAV